MTFELVDKRHLSSSASLGVEEKTAVRDAAGGTEDEASHAIMLKVMKGDYIQWCRGPIVSISRVIEVGIPNASRRAVAPVPDARMLRTVSTYWRNVFLRRP